MAIKRVTKKRIVTSFNNLTQELQDAVNEHYNKDFSEAMMRIEKPNGDFFYAVPYATEEVDYLVKIIVKIDDKSHEEFDKGYIDDEIKESEEMEHSIKDEDEEM